MSFFSNLRRLLNLNIFDPPRFKILHKYLSCKNVSILDVGCGYQSAHHTKNYFPLCKYYGLDKKIIYKNTEPDIPCMEQFWLTDLEKSDLHEIPDNFFDVIIFSHVIEHLSNGKEVLIRLSQKLKPSSVIYIEFPSYHTKVLPSLKKIRVPFNFFDDSSHIKLYRKNEIIEILQNENFKIKTARIYFNWKKILFLPISLAIRFKKERWKFAYELWWLVGWCTYIVAIKQ